MRSALTLASTFATTTQLPTSSSASDFQRRPGFHLPTNRPPDRRSDAPRSTTGSPIPTLAPISGNEISRHLDALIQIATDNNGIPAAGTNGYVQSCRSSRYRHLTYCSVSR